MIKTNIVETIRQRGLAETVSVTVDGDTWTFAHAITGDPIVAFTVWDRTARNLATFEVTRLNGPWDALWLAVKLLDAYWPARRPQRSEIR